VLLCLLLIQSGCLVGPDYKPQDVNAPAEWAGTQNTASPDTMLLEWWTEFNDANLTSLIERAMKSNLDLRLAEERIRESRAASGVVSSGFWPTANVSGGAFRNRDAAGVKTNLFQTGLDAAWELDIFGGTRRALRRQRPR